MPATAACHRCGSVFKPKRIEQRFCSVACRSSAQERWVDFVCQQCGGVSRRRPWQTSKDGQLIRYCSSACYAVARTGKPRGDYFEPEERQCVVCSTSFLVGGRGRPLKRTRFCSNACKFAGRYRHGASAKALTEIDAAYMAGLVDGEGSIMVLNHRGVAHIRIAVANTYLPVLDWIVEVAAVGFVAMKKMVNPKHKPGGQWWCSAEAAESVIKQIRPYLKIKPAQADLALETQERLRNPSLKADRSWQTDYIERSKTLNRRGPLADASSGG